MTRSRARLTPTLTLTPTPTPPPNSTPAPNQVTGTMMAGGLSLASAVVSVLTNEVFTVMALPLSRKAGPTSRTGFERNIFNPNPNP